MQVKYVKQRYVDIYGNQDPEIIQAQQKQPKRTQTPPKLNASMNISRVTKVSSQANTFQAINELKKSQQHIDSLKRRLSYLKIHQQRNIQKVYTNQKKIDLHYHAQQEAKKDKIRNLRYLQALRRGIQQQREANSLQKRQREKKLREAKQMLHNSHQRDVQMTKKKSQQIAKNIKAMKSFEFNQKKTRRDAIVEIEQKNKESIKLKIQHKLGDIHLTRAIDASRFKQKSLQTQLQMFELSRLESEMIQRQSKSRMVCQQSQKRLRSVRKQTQKTYRSQRTSQRTQGLLPDISFRSGRNNNIVVI